MKFLVIRFSSIGDIVLTTPVVRCLKQQVKGAEIHYLTKPQFAGILLHNPYIDKIHTTKNSWNEMMDDLRKESFDYIIDLHNNIRTLRVKMGLQTIENFSFPKLNFQKWLLTAWKINRMPDIHIVDRYLTTLKTFGVVNDGKGLDYFIPENERVSVDDLPTSHQAGYMAIVIGAALETKQLPVHKLKQLCASIQHPIVLLGGKEDVENGGLIASIDPIKIYNACGKFKLNESADLIQRAKLVVTHDTGLMHIAAALKKPTITVWGNTLPALGMSAYYGNMVVNNAQFEVSNLSCRPCSKIGFHTCPKKHFNCMELQDIHAITAKVQQLLR